MKNVILFAIVASVLAISCNNAPSTKKEKGPAEFVSRYESPWDSTFVNSMFDSSTTAEHEKEMEKFLTGKKKHNNMVLTTARFYMPKRYVRSSPKGSSIMDKYVIAPQKMFTLAIKVFEKSLGTDSAAKFMYEAVRFRAPTECANGTEYIEYDNSVDILGFTLSLCSDGLREKIKTIVLNASDKDRDPSWIRYYEHK